jgi:hypothetical protein
VKTTVLGYATTTTLGEVPFVHALMTTESARNDKRQPWWSGECIFASVEHRLNDSASSVLNVAYPRSYTHLTTWGSPRRHRIPGRAGKAGGSLTVRVKDLRSWLSCR